MATKRHKPEEIVTKLRQVEVLVGQGSARVDAIREVRITDLTMPQTWHLPSFAGKRKLLLSWLANPAHQEAHYRAGVSLLAGILRQLADEVEGVG
jgi:hypothetical protein